MSMHPVATHLGRDPAPPLRTTSHLPWLDGLRGVAALWVLVSHVLILTGVRAVPLLSWGSLAVDLFMLLSGFLMAHHYLLRRSREPWEARTTWMAFWVRRLFRIVPLYYVLLLAALVLGPWLGDFREAVARVWPETATPATRYHDQSLVNILAHVSFVFGALPAYAFRTPLPDWSIGLEMSFYLAFPFLMLAVDRFGAIRAGLVAVAISLGLLYAFRGFFQQFEMPSFLPMKLYLFFIGIWIAVSRMRGGMKPCLAAALALAAMYCAIERSEQSGARILLVLAMFYLMNDGSLPCGAWLGGLAEKARAAFSSPLCRFLGDTSYGVYLVHLILLLPVAGGLTLYPAYLAASGPVRFAVCFLATAPAVYLAAWLLFVTVEARGIRLGKAVVQQMAAAGKRKAALRA